jgi:hypothetical protein
METRIETITPERAKEYLELNTTKNRGLIANHVRLLAREMRAGNWQLNGESIKFSRMQRAGRVLVDGQHRLRAIIVANTPITTMVIDDVPAKTFLTLDTGKNRSGKHTLEIMGEKNATLLSAALRCLFHYKTHKTIFRQFAVTNSDLVNTLQDHPDIKKHLYAGPKVNRLAPGGFAVFLSYALSFHHKDAATDFFYHVSTGANLDTTSPIIHYRNFVFDYQLRKLRRPRNKKHADLIMAWNGFIQGEKWKKFPDYDTQPKIYGVDRAALFGFDPQEAAIDGVEIENGQVKMVIEEHGSRKQLLFPIKKKTKEVE